MTIVDEELVQNGKPVLMGSYGYCNGPVDIYRRVHEGETREQLKERMSAVSEFFIQAFGLEAWRRGFPAGQQPNRRR